MGGAAVAVSHTAVAGRAIYVQICGRTYSGFNGSDDFDVSCTFGATALTRKASWAAAGASDVMRAWVFSLPATSVVAGTALVTFTHPALGGIEEYSVIAYNVANAPVDGGIILAGGYLNFSNTTTLTKTALAWGSEGLQITAAWGRQGALGLAIAEGTQFASVTGMVLNKRIGNNGEMSFTASRTGSGLLGMFSFLIPGSAQSVTGGVAQPIMTGWATLSSPVSAGTFLGAMGLPYGISFGGAPGQGRQANILPRPGTVRSMIVRSSVPLASGQTVRCELVRGGYGEASESVGRAYINPTGVYVDLVGPAQEAQIDGLALAHYEYEQLSPAFTYLSGAGTIVDVAFTATLLDESGDSNQQMYGGGHLGFGSTSVGVTERRAALHPMDAPWATSPSSQKSVIKIDITVNQLVAIYEKDVAPTPNVDYYVELDGVLQDGTGGTVDTKATLVPNTMNRAYGRRRFTLPAAPGQFLAHAAIMRSALCDLRSAAMLQAQPTIPGQFMLSGHTSHADTATFTTSANSADNNTKASAADESHVAQPIPPMTFTGDDLHILGLYEDLDGTAPGGVTAWTTALRKNLAASTMPDLVVTGASTTGTTAGDVPFAGGDLVSLRWTATGLPNALRQFWTIPGFLTPPTNEGEEPPPDEEPIPGESPCTAPKTGCWGEHAQPQIACADEHGDVKASSWTGSMPLPPTVATSEDEG